MKIGCVILAGGKSTRMQKDKAFLEIEGKPFIQHLMDKLDFFEEKMISISNRDIETSWKKVTDRYEHHGPMGGIHAALLSCYSDALFVVSCDQPTIDPSLIKTLCLSLNEDTDAIVVKEKNGRIHPLCAIYKKTTLRIFEQQLSSNRNRLMEALNQMNVHFIETSQPLLNINTPEDYQNLIKQ